MITTLGMRAHHAGGYGADDQITALVATDITPEQVTARSDALMMRPTQESVDDRGRETARPDR